MRAIGYLLSFHSTGPASGPGALGPAPAHFPLGSPSVGKEDPPLGAPHPDSSLSLFPTQFPPHIFHFPTSFLIRSHKGQDRSRRLLGSLCTPIEKEFGSD